MNELEKYAAKKNILSSLWKHRGELGREVLKEIKASPSVISGREVRKAKAGRARADKWHKKFKADEASYGKKAKELGDKMDGTVGWDEYHKASGKYNKVVEKKRKARSAARFANADKRIADLSIRNEKRRRKRHLTGLGVVGTSAIGGAALYKRKKNKGTKKLEKYAAKKLLITKLARVRGSWLFGRTEAPPREPKPAPKGVAMTPRYPQVPIVDPNSGRIFSHKERHYLQSLPKKLRGPSWKDTEPANQQPGMPGGPVLRPKTDAYFWSGKGGGKHAE